MDIKKLELINGKDITDYIYRLLHNLRLKELHDELEEEYVFIAYRIRLNRIFKQLDTYSGIRVLSFILIYEWMRSIRIEF